MSSDRAASSYTPSGVDYIIEYYGHRLHEIEPLLAEPEFRLNDFADEPTITPSVVQSFLRTLRQQGIVTVPRRERENGTAKCVYRWTSGARAKIRAYLDRQDTLPCGHRWHIHNPRETPDGVYGCKECPETFTREAVLEAGGRS